MSARVGRLFDEHDVLLTPVVSRPAVPAGLMEGGGATVTYQWTLLSLAAPLETARPWADRRPPGALTAGTEGAVSDD